MSPRVAARPARRGALLLGALLACVPTPPPVTRLPPLPDGPRTGVPPEKNPFLHAHGRQLRDGSGRLVVLKGMAFGNEVWGNPSSAPTHHHGEADYRTLASLGFNTVRFYLNHRLLEGDDGGWREAGFAWIDQNIAWARAARIGLVLNLHVPPGGYQSGGQGGRLWTDAENQRRFVALWGELARRYRDEPVILGYDLLNEPVSPTGVAGWEELARHAVAAIRAVDPRHALFIERLNAVIEPGGRADWAEDRNGELNFFLVNDTNVVYEFHFYGPMAFTHQGAPWVDGLRGVRTSWPGRFDEWGTSYNADRAWLEARLGRYAAFGQRHGVPVYLGEFGVIRNGFEGGRNGAGWVSDVLDVALARGMSVTYHAFHERYFGLYGNDTDRPPAELNAGLAEVFRKKLR